MRPPARLLLGALTALALLAPASANGFQVGFADHLFGGPDGGRWAQRAVGAGADAMRVNVYWSIVATAEPERPRDAGDPAYDWEPIDRAVRSAEAAGLEVLMTVLSAPPWAEGPYRPGPEEAPAGTWRPDPAAYADFAHAIATRYSGFYPDPDGSGSLPEVDTWSAWNEPNISQYLTPQYVNGRNASAGIYVRLLNAFGGAVEAVNPDATIVTGGTAPAGDPVERRRTAPLEFWREVLCLTPDGRAADFCAAAERPRFDLLAHHPISHLSSPAVSGIEADDITAVDFGELGRLLREAEAARTIDSREEHGLLAPEIWWETDPPERNGVSQARQARYTALAIYLLWRQGAEGVYFLQMRDAKRVSGEPGLNSYQTGIYTYRDRRKPAHDAVRFPVVLDRLDRDRVLAWARAPRAGRMRIELKPRGGEWRRVEGARVARGEIVTEELRLRGRARARAKVAGVSSPVWRLRR
jgi:hypothetical protein